jgi:hypothetical protein
MQSLLAYRKFGKLAREQYERDRKRAEALERGNAETEGAVGLEKAKSSTQSPDLRDPEKAELPGASNHSDTSLSGESDDPTVQIEGLERDATLEATRSMGTRMGHALTGIEVRSLTKELTRTRTRRSGKGKGNEKAQDRETVFVVGYDTENDPMNPKNWSFVTRISATFLIASIGVSRKNSWTIHITSSPFSLCGPIALNTVKPLDIQNVCQL